jgi:hypothetical protein
MRKRCSGLLVYAAVIGFAFGLATLFAAETSKETAPIPSQPPAPPIKVERLTKTEQLAWQQLLEQDAKFAQYMADRKAFFDEGCKAHHIESDCQFDPQKLTFIQAAKPEAEDSPKEKK